MSNSPKKGQRKRVIARAAMESQAEASSSYHLPSLDPSLDQEQATWLELHSLASLKLNLQHVIRDCTLPRQCPLEEFPLATDTNLPTAELHAPLKTPPPMVRLNTQQLAVKSTQLELAVAMYQKRIKDLSHGSREVFGEVQGESVCLLVDTSNQHCGKKEEKGVEEEGEGTEEEEGDGGEKEERKFSKCRDNLKLLFEEQLNQKKSVQVLQFGSETSPTQPLSLNFREYHKRSMLTALEWLDSLKGTGNCNLLGALKTILELPDIDTILLVLGSRPDQYSHVLVDYMTDRLAVNHTPTLHLVAHNSDRETADLLSRMAAETNGHFHKYSPSDSVDQPAEDTEISRVEEEIKKAEEVMADLERVKLGQLPHSVLNILRQLLIANSGLAVSQLPCCFSSPSFPLSSFSSHQPQPALWQESVVSNIWLERHSIEAAGLSIYQALAPNAYSQVETHLRVTEKSVASTVYDNEMPQFTWSDGTQKYLHVDIHQLQDYQHKMEVYILQILQRLNWLASGSRAPFGTITEKNVLLLLECSAATQPHIMRLQTHLLLLLQDQLPHITHFNIIRFNSDYCSWQEYWVEPTQDTLSEAWKWLLEMSPTGSCSVLSALDAALATDVYTTDDAGGATEGTTKGTTEGAEGTTEGAEGTTDSATEEKEMGIYLVASSLPNEEMETICSYLHEKTATRKARVHVVQYHPTATTLGQTVARCTLSTEGGRYGNEEEITHFLQKIAVAGRGRFHSYKGPGIQEITSLCEVGGDDIDQVLNELHKAQDHLKAAHKIVEDYRKFCRRTVLPAEPPLSLSPSTLTQPPPLYPRPTTSFIVRMNANSKKMTKSASDSSLCLRTAKTERSRQAKHSKTSSFYLNRGNHKGLLYELTEQTTKSCKRKTIHHEELISSSEWLSKYGLEYLGLIFDCVIADKKSAHDRLQRASYKHINREGEVVELYLSYQGLKRYVRRVSQAKETYRARLTMLNRECHRHFGCIIESKVLFLIDISSSMAEFYEGVASALTKLLHGKPHKMKQFNLVAYNNSVKKWQEKLVPCSSENVAEASEWLAHLRPGGCSCLLDAVKICLELKADTIYLITDGTADHTHDFLLSQLPLLRGSYQHTWRVNTVAYHCSQQSSYTFLKHLACETNGRYHSYPWAKGFSSVSPAELVQNRYLGDDVREIAEEMVLADNYLSRAASYL